MLKTLQTLPQYCLPQHALSRLLGKVANSRRVRLKNWLIRRAIKTFDIDMQDALLQDLNAYPTFNAFFTRALKPEARPLPTDPGLIASPADGIISQIGAIKTGRLIQAKGHDFSLMELLGGQTRHLEQFDEGLFTTIYLSPRDYHRVHIPFAGKLTAMTHIPGSLFSVNQRTAAAVKNLFARNERVVCYFDTQFGPMAVILVGAFFVASIATVWSGIVSPPTRHTVRHIEYQGIEQRQFKRGDEIGHFQFGSTAIVLLPKGAAQWLAQRKAGDFVYMGEALAHLIKL